MQTALSLTLILVVLELFEAMIQYADTLGGVIERLYGWYRKSVFLFFLIHPGFYYMLLVVMITGTFNLYTIVIIAMKVFDIYYKVKLIETLYLEQQVPNDLAAMLQWRIPGWFFLTGVMLYPPLLYLALQ